MGDVEWNARTPWEIMPLVAVLDIILPLKALPASVTQYTLDTFHSFVCVNCCVNMRKLPYT
jgi:hypothetical protein